MGKPGGFFKKLKAKQKREASQRRRGTKGASTEERRRKHNERVELYAARREAEQLAAVSSSSDSEPSTDSEAEMAPADRKLRKLRAMLGVRAAPANGSGGNSRRRCAKRARSPAPGDESDSDKSVIVDSDNEEEEEEARTRPTRPSKSKKATAAGKAAEGDDDDDDEAEADDWQTFIGGEDADDEESDDEEDEEGELSDGDRLDDDDLLVDVGSDADEDEDEEEGESNPFFDMLEEGEEEEEDEEDLIDPNEFEEEEEEEDDEEDAEDQYTGDDDDDDDDDDDSAPRRAADLSKDAESRALLPQFKLGSTSLATLQSSGAVSSPSDPWYLKYHRDAKTEIDRTPLRPVAVDGDALTALSDSNAPLVQRAKRREAAEGAAAKKDVFFVTSEDYAAVQPDNVSVAATAAAQEYLKRHPPFSGAAAAAASASASASTSSGASAAAGTGARRPPYVHEALWERWVQYRTSDDAVAAAEATNFYRNTAGVVMTAEERGFFDMLQGYSDVMDCLRCWQKAESRREIFALHLLNHWFKARATVLAHDKMLAAHKERQRRRKHLQQQAAKAATTTSSGGKNGAAKTAERRRIQFADEKGLDDEDEDEAGNGDDDDDLELRDRGFGKTRLLLMLPMRNMAYEYVNTIVRILGADPADCPKLAMFEQDFTEVEEAMDPTFKRRPREYRRQFAGNIDDSFCVGLRLEPGRVHVYAHPLNSDIIICSPLGLRRRLEKNGDILVSLSSIEVCVMDEAHVLLEQNWQQVTAVMELLNRRPTDTTHGLSDLRRVYAWALEGKSGRHRQTIVSSDISNAAILSTFRSAVNTFGKVVLQPRTDAGVLARVQVPVRQHFIRFEPSALDAVDDERFDFFTKNVYASRIHPVVERDVRTIIVVPSYFDFVRLRNHMFRDYRESFTAISEYTSVKQQRRALGQFTDLERPLLLVTERFYFFKRYFVKFAEVLVFYSPPLFPSFYAALVNRLVATSPNAFAMTVFCQYDTHELNRIVGTNRMRHMLERESGIFSFVTS